MSQIRYNGVTLPLAFTSDFRQEALYDDMGGTDYFVTKFDIRTQCVINSAYLAQLVPDIAAVDGTDFTSNSADLMNMIRKRLLVPRRQLSVSFNGVELIPTVTGLPGTVDAQNGPKPQSCTVQSLTNTTFLLTYHVLAHYWECPNINPGSTPLVQNAASGPVLFNRWSETVDIDNRNFSRRTRRGKFMIRSDNSDGKIVDQYRSQMAILGVPNGFLRESSSYTVDPSGLAIEYQIVDKEVYILPPLPAYEAEGTYVESAVRAPGANRWAEVRVRLKGDRNTNKAELLETALKVAASKVLRAQQDEGQNVRGLPMDVTLSSELYDNAVEARIRAMLGPMGSSNGNARKEQTWGFRFDRITETPGIDNQPSYFQRGNISILLQAASYFDPCLRAKLQCETGQMDIGMAPGTAGNTREGPGSTTPGNPFGADNPGACTQAIGGIVSITTGVIAADDFLAKFQKLSPDLSIWVDYMIETRLESDKHIYMMPIASPTGFGGNTAAFVQLAAPTSLVIIDWTASKTLDQPEIPSPDIGPFAVLLDEHYETAMLVLATDGVTPLYRISGTYCYGLKLPNERPILDLRWPRPPWMLDDFNRAPSLGNYFGGLLTQ
mgnify:CR=1 FL=1